MKIIASRLTQSLLDRKCINFVPITAKDIEYIREGQQRICNCYMIAPLDTLTYSPNGRKLLTQNINKAQCDDDTLLYRFTFKNVNKDQEDYYISSLDYPYTYVIDERESNTIFKSMSIAMNKLIKKHPWKKSIFNRLAVHNELCEYNSPSRFLSMFTGVQPRNLCEYKINYSLKKYRNEALVLLTQMEKEKEEGFSFIAGTGFFPRDMEFYDWHCYCIIDINTQKQSITLKNKRRNTIKEYSFDKFIENFKFITGYFNKDLK